MSKPIFERMEETLSRNDPRVWEVVSEKLAKDAGYWKQRALVAEAYHGTDHSPHFAASELGTPSRPNPHAPLHRAIGRSQNGLPDPQTPNQVFWEKL